MERAGALGRVEERNDGFLSSADGMGVRRLVSLSLILVPPSGFLGSQRETVISAEPSLGK